MPASSERSINGDGGGVKVDGNRMNFDIPSGLTDLLQDFTVAVLRSRPSDLHQFAAGYFNGVYERRQQTTKNYDVNNGIEGTSSLSSSSSHAHSSDGGHVGDGANTADRTSRSDPAPPTVIASTPTRQHSSDDDMPLEPPPVTACTRRKSVAAERYDPEADHDDGIKVTHPKSAEQRNRLNDAVKHILLFRSLEEKQLLEVIDAMFERKVCAGEHVIKEGDDGDNFYVIDSGVYDILVNGKKVGVYDNMGSFGELALMYNMPRAATIVAVTDGNLWAMDRSTFRRIVLKNAFNKRKMYEALLESVPLLKSLDMYERMNIADALVSKQFNDGDVVIKQGDAADCMFFIEDGEVKIAMKQSVNDPEREVTRCNKGGYFGELALVTHKPRAASAYAVGSVRLAVLDVAAFERVLGPCMDIMKRNIETYEEQLIQIFGSKITIADDI